MHEVGLAIRVARSDALDGNEAGDGEKDPVEGPLELSGEFKPAQVSPSFRKRRAFLPS